MAPIQETANYTPEIPRCYGGKATLLTCTDACAEAGGIRLVMAAEQRHCITPVVAGRYGHIVRDLCLDRLEWKKPFGK